jgi:hypothetical protein
MEGTVASVPPRGARRRLLSGGIGSPPPHCPQAAVAPANGRDVTAEKIGTVIGIVEATAAAKGTKPG